jgi:hypothetical protein
MMPIDTTSLSSLGLATLGLTLYVAGGLRFRRWAVDGRPGVPRFSSRVETVLLWLLYSGALSIAIVVARQTLREI